MKQASDRRVVLYLITKATQGGAQKYVYDLATNLPKNEFEPIVAYGTAGKLVRDLGAAGVRTHPLPSLGRDIALLSDIKSFFEIRAAIRALKPEIVHLNSSKAAALGALAARNAGVPKILFTVHGWPFKEKKNILWRGMVYLLSWITALLSDATILVSENDTRLARSMWGTENIFFIPLGMSPIRTLPPSEAFPRMFGSEHPPELKGNTRRLVTIAELTPNKGIRYAIAAVSELSRRDIDCIYVIAGEGEERSSLEALAKDLGLGGRVYFPGFVPNAAEYLSGFDVFVLHSLKEGMPYSLLEAGSVGIPIVATSAVDPSLKERFPKMRIVPPRDPYALADAVAELSRLPRSLQTGHSTSSIPAMMERVLTLYRG